MLIANIAILFIVFLFLIYYYQTIPNSLCYLYCQSNKFYCFAFQKNMVHGEARAEFCSLYFFRFRFLLLRHFLFPYAIHLYLYTLRWMQRHLWFGLYHKRFCLFKKYFKLFFVKYTGYCSSVLSLSLSFVPIYILLSCDNINVNGSPTADSILA